MRIYGLSILLKDAPEYAKGIVGCGTSIEKAIESYVDGLKDYKGNHWGV